VCFGPGEGRERRPDALGKRFSGVVNESRSIQDGLDVRLLEDAGRNPFGDGDDGNVTLFHDFLLLFGLMEDTIKKTGASRRIPPFLLTERVEQAVDRVLDVTQRALVLLGHLGFLRHVFALGATHLEDQGAFLAHHGLLGEEQQLADTALGAFVHWGRFPLLVQGEPLRPRRLFPAVNGHNHQVASLLTGHGDVLVHGNLLLLGLGFGGGVVDGGRGVSGLFHENLLFGFVGVFEFNPVSLAGAL